MFFASPLKLFKFCNYKVVIIRLMRQGTIGAILHSFIGETVIAAAVL